MVEVDRCDQNTSNYCISMRSKKWWWALFALIPDMVMLNYLLLLGENKKSEDSTLDLLAFRREAVQTYSKKYLQPLYRAERPRGRIPPTYRRFSMGVRLDRVDRYQSYPSSQGKCEVCMKNTRKG